ncbi:MAG: amidinotransferase, partial [Bacteroidetes bacterium]
QMSAFAGNMLQVAGTGGKPLTVLSETAHRSLEPAQLAALERHNPLLPCAIPVIETSGGGSVRCMMAEIFLPPKGEGAP